MRDRRKGKTMTLDEAIGDMRAAHEADMDFILSSNDLKDVIGYLEELKRYRENAGLRELIEIAGEEAEKTSRSEFKCKLDRMHVGTLDVNGLEMKVYAGYLVGYVVSGRNGEKSIKHKMTLIEV